MIFCGVLQFLIIFLYNFEVGIFVDWWENVKLSDFYMVKIYVKWLNMVRIQLINQGELEMYCLKQ